MRPPQKNDDANGQDRIGELLPESCEPFLKRGPSFVLALEHGGDPAEFRPHAGGRHQAPSPAVSHQGAFVGHVFPVPEGQVLFPERRAVLFHGYGLAGQSRFIDSKLDRFREPDIGRRHVARLQEHQVPGNELFRCERLGLPVPNHGRRRGRHLFQCGHGLFSAVFLNEPEHGIQKHDHGDGDGIRRFADHAGHDRGGDEHENHEVLELIQKHHPQRFAPFFDQLVGAVFLIAATRFFRSKARFGRLQFLRGFIRIKLVPVD